MRHLTAARIGLGHRLLTALLGATIAVVSVGPGARPAAAASPPTIAPDASLVTAAEETLATLTGTYNDSDGDTVTLTTDTGSIERTTGTSSGTWTWEYPALDGPADLTVTVSADDGTSVTSATFEVVVTNTPPSASTHGQALAPLKSKSARPFVWTAGDVAADTVTTHGSCGTGTPVGQDPTPAGPGHEVDCVFGTPGPTLVGGTASDEDGGFTDGRIPVYVTARVRSVADGQMVIDGSANQSLSGGSLAIVDLNGDGLGDVAVGRRPDQGVPAATSPVSVFVVFGRSTAASINLDTLAPSAGFKITSPEVGDLFGWSLSNAGDVNHDGIGDLIIGAPGASPQSRSLAGAAYVIFGQPHPTDIDLASPPAGWGFRIDGAAANDSAGFAVAGLGDVNGDHVADIAISSPLADPASRNAAGSVEVILGSAAPADVDLAAVPAGHGFAAIGGVGDGAGFAIAGGDVNGDGLSDLVASGEAGQGDVWVVYGRASVVDADLTALTPGSGFAIAASTGGSYSFGTSVAVGDLDHDGFADIAIGAPGWGIGTFDPGAVYLVSGAATHASFSIDFPGTAHVHLIKGDVDAGFAGIALAMGDVNADGRPDLAIGARMAYQGAIGSAYVVLSTGTLTDVNLHVLSTRWVRFDADLRGSFAGRAVAAGDMTGDGRADIAVGVPVQLNQADVDVGRIGIFAGPLVDVTLPKVSVPIPSITALSTVGTSTVFVHLRWTGSDTGSGVASYDVSVRRDGGAWSTARTGLTTRSTDLSLVSGHLYEFRVRAHDAAANVGSWAYSSTVRLSTYQESNAALTFAGTWHGSTSPVYRGGKDRYSTAAGSKVTFRFVGRSLAWVSAIGPFSGTARVYVDGTFVATIHLWGPTNLYRRIVWSRNWSVAGSHVVVIRVAGTTGHPRVDIDAFVALR